MPRWGIGDAGGAGGAGGLASRARGGGRRRLPQNPRRHGGAGLGHQRLRTAGGGLLSSAREHRPAGRRPAGATQIKAGFKFGLAVLGDCTVRSWGTSNKAQLGNGSSRPRPTPCPSPGSPKSRKSRSPTPTPWRCATTAPSGPGAPRNSASGATAKRASNGPPARANRQFRAPRPAHRGARPRTRQADRGRRHARLRAAGQRRSDGLGR